MTTLFFRTRREDQLICRYADLQMATPGEDISISADLLDCLQRRSSVIFFTLTFMNDHFKHQAGGLADFYVARGRFVPINIVTRDDLVFVRRCTRRVNMNQCGVHATRAL